jgi:hypothetical protein
MRLLKTDYYKVGLFFAVLTLSLLGNDLYVVDKEGRAWKRRDNGWQRIESLPQKTHGPSPFLLGFPQEPDAHYGELHFDHEGNAALEVRNAYGSGFSLQTIDGSVIPFEAMVWRGREKTPIRQILPMPQGTGFIGVTTEGEVLRISIPPKTGPIIFDVETLLPPKSAWALTGVAKNEFVFEKFDGTGYSSIDPKDLPRGPKPVNLPDGQPLGRGKYEFATGGFLRFDAPAVVCPRAMSAVQRAMKARLEPVTAQ